MAAEQAKATIVDADIYVESFGNIEEANMVRKRLCLFICLFFLKLFLVNFPFSHFSLALCARLSSEWNGERGMQEDFEEELHGFEGEQ